MYNGPISGRGVRTAGSKLPYKVVMLPAVFPGTEPRFATMREAEEIILALRGRGYREASTRAVMEQKDVGRLATVRFLVPEIEATEDEEDGLIVDLMFASSGVEPEIVAASERMLIMQELVVPIVRAGHLFALKVLAGRPKDLQDCQFRWRRMGPEDLQEARETLELINQRGFHRGKDLDAEFARILELASGPDL